MVQLAVEGARGQVKALRQIDIPVSYRVGWPEAAKPGNVARVYPRMAQDLPDGTATPTAPSFQDTVAVRRVIAVVEEAAESGRRVVLVDVGNAANRRSP